jgi:hypothetical protein
LFRENKRGNLAFTKSGREQAVSKKASEWAEHVRAWRSGGRTQAAYCAEHGLKMGTLAHWSWRLGKEPSGVVAPTAKQALVPIHVAASVMAPLTAEVRFAGGSVHLPAGVDVAWAAALVKALAC